MLWKEFKNPKDMQKVISAIQNTKTRDIRIMEVCGTHTMAIAKSGIKSILPPNIKIVSGPGCPVCVTPQEDIDVVLELADNKNIIIATYGDMLRVPGSRHGLNLERMKALGANINMVYSAMDAVELAAGNTDKDVVFLGIGFETTTPGTALALETAAENRVENFYVMSMHKMVEPVLRTLIDMEDFNVDGFICPGHVSIILGEKGFQFLVDEYKIPSVIAGFENGDLITAIYRIINQIKDGKAILENIYPRAVSYNGNIKARDIIDKYFEPCDDIWRGMGVIEKSGLAIRKEYSCHDARLKYDIKVEPSSKLNACMCGEIIKGVKDPGCCPLFGSACTPENPMGPCMVSSEGSCAAHYKYQIL